MTEDIQNKILTISIPTWNRCELLRQLLDQLSNQIEKFNLSDKIEILVSNNGSVDDTEKRVMDFQNKYKFISYNNNGTNIGAKENVLRSMELASGKFLMVLGDDDRINENCLSNLVNFLETNSDTGVAIDCTKFKKNPFGKNASINLTSLLENFYWHIGNAGIFIVRTSFVKDNLKDHPYEYFSFSWPQTQLIILGLYHNKDLKCRVEKFDLISEAVHGQVTIYTSYYLWRTCYYDLFTAIESIKQEIDKPVVNAAKKYLIDNIVQLFYNVLQCGVFLDDKEVRQKTAKHISENLHLFTKKENFFFRIINTALLMPSPVSKFISNIFIFSVRGMKGIRKKNEFIKAEMLKKSEINEADNIVVREFQF